MSFYDFIINFNMRVHLFTHNSQPAKSISKNHFARIAAHALKYVMLLYALKHTHTHTHAFTLSSAHTVSMVFYNNNAIYM